MKYILLKEFQEIIKDYRFVLLIVIILTYSVISGTTNSSNYTNLKAQYDFQITQYNTKLIDCSKSLFSVAYMNHIAMKEIPTSIFLLGNSFYNYPNFSIIILPNFYFAKDIGSYLPQKNFNEKIEISNFIRFDLEFFVEIVMSFLFLFISYNGISKEKENGTLKLILSNSLHRHHFLFAKVLSHLILIIFSLIFIISIQLLIIVINGKIPLDYEIFKKIPSFLLFSISYLSFWMVLGLFISMLTKKSSLSLSYLLVIWVTLAIIIPLTGGLFVNNLHKKLPSSYEIENKYSELESDMWKECDQKNASWRGGQSNDPKEKKFFSIYLKYLEEFNKYQYSVGIQQVDQLKFLYNYSSISPVFLYRNLCEAFAGEGYEENYRFLQSLQLYRKNLIQSIVELDLKDKASSHLVLLETYMSQKNVDPSEIPRFEEIKYNILKVFRDNWKLILLFLSELFILLLISYFTFLRFDPR